MRRALLLVVVSLLPGGCTWFKARDTVRSVLTEARPRLDARRTALGPVEVHGDEIELLGGQLRLVVRLPDGNGAPLHHPAAATPDPASERASASAAHVINPSTMESDAAIAKLA